MRDAGGGSIVNISSIEGLAGAAGLSAYSASKFAVRGITKSAAQELGGYGIRVNSVHPGAILTDMIFEAAKSLEVGKGTDGGGNEKGHRGGADHYQRFMESIPLARVGEAKDVTSTVVFLASDESRYSTGSEFVVDGGILSGPGY
jgi:3alpha(or 20beta)-hydroxysteroid dehydrogenase